LQKKEKLLGLKRVGTSNSNNHTKGIAHFFKDQYPEICLSILKESLKVLQGVRKTLTIVPEWKNLNNITTNKKS